MKAKEHPTIEECEHEVACLRTLRDAAKETLTAYNRALNKAEKKLRAAQIRTAKAAEKARNEVAQKGGKASNAIKTSVKLCADDEGARAA